VITIQAGTPEPSPHTPCAVIAEPRRLARKPLKQTPAQAPASGTAPGGHSAPLSVLPQLATETLARAPGQWAVVRGAWCGVHAAS